MGSAAARSREGEGEGTSGTKNGSLTARLGTLSRDERAPRTVPLPSLSNLSNASLHAVISSCESVIFASRRWTACAVEMPEYHERLS